MKEVLLVVFKVRQGWKVTWNSLYMFSHVQINLEQFYFSRLPEKLTDFIYLSKLTNDYSFQNNFTAKCLIIIKYQPLNCSF
jgi:hypothetical protein